MDRVSIQLPLNYIGMNEGQCHISQCTEVIKISKLYIPLDVENTRTPLSLRLSMYWDAILLMMVSTFPPNKEQLFMIYILDRYLFTKGYPSSG